MPATASKLMPAFLAYEALGSGDADHIEALRGNLEEVLAKGDVLTPEDLFAKARYLQQTARIDPGLIPMEAVDTLVVGIAVLFAFSGIIGQPVTPSTIVSAAA